MSFPVVLSSSMSFPVGLQFNMSSEEMRDSARDGWTGNASTVSSLGWTPPDGRRMPLKRRGCEVILGFGPHDKQTRGPRDRGTGYRQETLGEPRFSCWPSRLTDGTSPQELTLLHQRMSSALSAEGSRSPVMIDRFRRGGRDGRLPCDDFYEQSREHASRNCEDNHGRASSPTPLIDRNVGGHHDGWQEAETLTCCTCRQAQAVCFSWAPSSRVPPKIPARPKPAPKMKEEIPYEIKNAREWDPTRTLEDRSSSESSDDDKYNEGGLR